MIRDTVWLVEDEPELGQAYAEFLGDHYNTQYFSSPLKALEEFDKGKTPQLVITDIRMPEMDGMSLISKFRNLGLSCPMLVVSGYVEKSHAINAIENGVFGVLEKPLDPRNLQEASQEAIRMSGLVNSMAQIIASFLRQNETMRSLLQLYTERYIHAENELMARGLPIHSKQPEVWQFLERMNEESFLERSKDIETNVFKTLFGEFERVASELKSAKYAQSALVTTKLLELKDAFKPESH